jgi:hypothetical protein
MTSKEALNTHQKALEINLDPSSYGSFAEIGAGQEVARWFLVVGGASGTVAKSISAYDKEVSDDLYGSGARYVSKERLQAMLDNEWTQLIDELDKSRGAHSCFFSFVDTISARNYAGTNTLASFPLSIPSLLAITPEQTSLTAGSACGSNRIPATNRAISCCISTCGILLVPSSRKASASSA